MAVATWEGWHAPARCRTRRRRARPEGRKAVLAWYANYRKRSVNSCEQEAGARGVETAVWGAAAVGQPLPAQSCDRRAVASRWTEQLPESTW